jgi:aspartyl-tRNA(Asn)/glutamyl-tRNA(Gln) amidotransferase subunit A
MLVPLAIGTDTAGSIRIPAAFCGIVGLRPTYGTIDTSGAFPLAPSLDTVGPMARTVADTALLAAAIAPGPRRHPRPPHDLMAERLVVAICPDLDDVEPAPAVRSVLSSAAATFADLGARVVEVPVPQIAPLFATLGTIVMAEGRHVHRRAGLWPSRRDEYGPDVRARLERAASVTLTRYLDAQDLRRRVAAAMHAVFRTADVLLSPASTVSPIPVGSRSADPPDGAVSFREQVMTPAAPQSLAGLPACVVRAGFDDRGVPVGVQLTAPAGADADLLAVAARYEEATAAIQRRAAPDPRPGWASGSP